jgi:two-component system, OmpR family, response regulator RegX3
MPGGTLRRDTTATASVLRRRSNPVPAVQLGDTEKIIFASTEPVAEDKPRRELGLMSSMEPRPTDMPQTYRYMSVNPQSLGRLRILGIGDVELHLDGHRLFVRGKPVHLPRKEFVVLRYLMDNAGRVVTRRELLDNAWGPDCRDTRNYLEVHIRRLRTKIESDPFRPTHIRTVRGIGYIFDLPDSQQPAPIINDYSDTRIDQD